MQIRSFQTLPLADLHVHLRQGESLSHLAQQTARYADVCLAMPNTSPPLIDVGGIRSYLDSVCQAAPAMRTLLTFFLDESVDIGWVEAIAESRQALGVVAGKLYPRGVTNNSEHGVAWESVKNQSRKLWKILTLMETHGLVLCLHAEAPAGHVASMEETESAWIEPISAISAEFPKLSIVIEHISTARMASWLIHHGGNRIAATITPAHLLWHRGDLFNGGLLVDRFLKPEIKYPPDRDELWKALLKSNKFFLGSDSAPHPREKKRAACCSCGVYSAAVLPELLAEMFEDRGLDLSILEDFACRRGPAFYGLSLSSQDRLLFTRESWKYEPEADFVSPWDGYTFRWKARRVASK